MGHSKTRTDRINVLIIGVIDYRNRDKSNNTEHLTIPICSVYGRHFTHLIN